MGSEMCIRDRLGSAWLSLGYCFDLGSILTISLNNRLSVQILFEFYISDEQYVLCITCGLREGDLVVLNEDEDFVKSEFANTDFIWDDLMTSMLGNSYNVVPKLFSVKDSEIVALPSPDGSQIDRFHFPKTVVTKVGKACLLGPGTPATPKCPSTNSDDNDSEDGKYSLDTKKKITNHKLTID